MARGSKADVRIDGLTEAKATLAALPEAFKNQVRESLDIGSAIILSEAGRRVPVRFGDLKRSLGRNIRDDGLQVAVGSGDHKAQWVEFATNDTPAQPFLYPAFRQGSRFVRGSMRSWAENAGEQARFRTKRSGRVRRAQAK